MTSSATSSFDASPSDMSDIDGASSAVGLSGPEHAAHRRRMFDLVRRIRGTGVDAYLDIPVIAAMGSQSAGKSSLIEAISGIMLPRKSGTCTRCPTECQLSYADQPWTCTISLRLTTNAQGVPLDPPQNVTFGQAIFDKVDVTERVRRAQRAILNPSRSADHFLTGPENDGTADETSFSSNCIVLQISGRDVADLHFVDLPGLIAGGAQNDMELIENLVVSYIEKPSCIILLTVACETDFENQKAHRLAERFDPNGERTIGVLTKPDRIPATEEASWMKLVKGEGHNAIPWFCVKRPDTQAIASGITWEKAGQAESEFFSQRVPWRSMEGKHKERLGTVKLTRRLSDVLSALVTARLPDIKKELGKVLSKTEHEISDLPPPLTNEPVTEILRMIGAFMREVVKHTDGVPGRDGLLQAMRPAQIAFQSSIRLTAPDFRPYHRTHQHLTAAQMGPPAFLSNEEVLLYHNMEQPSALPSSQDVDSDEESESADEESESADEESESDSEEGLTGEILFINEVMEEARWAVTRELPNNYPFIVQKDMIVRFVRKWNQPSQELFNITKRKLAKRIQRIVTEQFGHVGNGGLKQRISYLVTEHINSCAEQTAKRLDFLMKLEAEPYTRNTHYFNDYRDKFFAYYKGYYSRDSIGDFVEKLNASYQTLEFRNALHAITTNLLIVGIRGVKPVALATLAPADPMEAALKIMADVRAYFQVAYKRYVDNVPMTIDQELVRGMCDGLEAAISNGIGINGPDGYERCKSLLREPAAIGERRSELEGKRNRLLMAKQELLDMFA